MNIFNMTALQLGEKINKREIGVLEAVKEAVKYIKDTDKKYNAFITVCEEEALGRAEDVQKKINEGKLNGPLAGVPMAVKDNICTSGIKTTCASKMLENFIPAYNAEAIERLYNAGAILLGKLNMDEFAMGSTSETSFFGAVKNPEDTGRSPGGSSGGPAAAVASNEIWYSLGSDTGGSIRQPCSFTGTTGIKPTYGRVSRYGLIAYASSFDQIGPIAKNVSDCAAVLNVISGYDEKDGTSSKSEKGDFLKNLVYGVENMKIGIPREYFEESMDQEVKDAVLNAAKQFEIMGARVEEFSLEAVKYAVPAYYIIASAEASSNLSRYDGIKYGYRAENCKNISELYERSRTDGFGEEVKRRIMLGNFVLSSGYYDAYYNKALRVRNIIKRSFDKAFEKYDIILSPTAPETALKLGESLSDPVKMYSGDIFTVSANLTGLPGMTLPCGRDTAGLPIGLQLTGPAWKESNLIRAGYTFESWSGYREAKR